ncbi:MAG: hypothetical protein FJ030_07905 [Chloroflexi bacterium]|nr:hypothetical protein [Chloroflexota bacterium]
MFAHWLLNEPIPAHRPLLHAAPSVWHVIVSVAGIIIVVCIIFLLARPDRKHDTYEREDNENI